MKYSVCMRMSHCKPFCARVCKLFCTAAGIQGTQHYSVARRHGQCMCMFLGMYMYLCVYMYAPTCFVILCECMRALTVVATHLPSPERLDFSSHSLEQTRDHGCTWYVSNFTIVMVVVFLLLLLLASRHRKKCIC
jgi:hypothetical protein